MPIVLHEITHLNQSGVSQQYFLDKEKQLKTSDLTWGAGFLVEGDATVHQIVTKPIVFGTPSAIDFIRNSSITKEAFLHAPTAESSAYIRDVSYYKKFEMLAGYKVMLDYKTGKISFDGVLNAIDKKYGTGTGWKLYSLINEIEKTRILKKTRNSDGQFNSMVELEKLFLNCLIKDVSRLNNKQDVQKYFNAYRAYKNLYMPYFSEYKSNAIQPYTKSLTDALLPTTTIENMLVDKAIAYKALPVFSKNSDMNKKIAKSLFYVDYNMLMNNSILGTNIPSQPENLFTTRYSVKTSGNSTILTLYKGKKSVDITVSSNGNISMKNSTLKPTIFIFNK